MELQGIFVVNDKENAVAQIDSLCNKYGLKIAANNVQTKALFRAYCRDTINMLEKYFATELQGASRCKRFVEDLSHSDDIRLTQTGTIQIFDILLQLRHIAQNAILIKDMPSCKKLTELSTEDAVAAI